MSMMKKFLPMVMLLLAACAPTPQNYKQHVSDSVQDHVHYPDGASEASGQVVVRIRVDRDGHLIQEGLETSSKDDVLDQAALDAVKQAAPFPSLPEDTLGEIKNYQEVFDFLIPVNFKAPTGGAPL